MNPNRLNHGFITCLILAVLAGCKSTPTKPETQENFSATNTEQLKQDEVMGESLPVSKPSSRESIVLKLLEAGENALMQNRLLKPEYDNALDRFSAVLLFQPDNERALAGLQSVTLALADQFREAMTKRRLRQGRRILREMEEISPQSPLLAELHTQYKQAAEAVQARLRAEQVAKPGEELVLLDPEDLAARSAQSVAVLQRIAHRIQETDESVMIYARSDVEGRWIYKQMKESVAGYRIRGDIRVSKRPALKLMAPL